MIHLIGNAHIDPVWLWQWQEGFQEVKATFRSALDRISEYDGFVFTCACAGYYKWVEENAPDMFKEIQRRVKEGRWRIVGGMWIQPDCNMPSGESFIRQFLYSQRYFYEKFGVTAKTAYNVDSFGHNAMLPQIFKRCGVDNYVMMRPGVHENAEIPGWVFDWVAPDGTSVKTYRIPDGYGAGAARVVSDMEKCEAISKENGLPMMCFYGVGNHGGGPTIKTLNAINEYLVSRPDAGFKFSSPDDYFGELKGYKLPEWRNELQHHASGCYSATSLIKKYNRLAENALLRAETMGVIARRLAGRKIGDMRQGWENVMFNQFHDVMCGCSIKEAYEDARSALGETINIAAREENAAVQTMSWRVDTMQGVKERTRSKEEHFRLWEHDDLGTPLIVFNPHAFTLRQNVQLFGLCRRATDEKGNDIPMQVVRGSRTNNEDKWDTMISAEVPGYGYRLYWIYLNGEKTEADNRLKATKTCLENDFVRIEFNEKTGAVSSLVDKRTGYDAIAADSALELYDNEFADTWAHMEFTFDDKKGEFGKARFTLKESGPVRARLKVETSCRDSKLMSEYTLGADDDFVTVNARLDMREEFRMAKLAFKVNAKAPKAVSEIAYGVIERPMVGTEESAQRWSFVGDDNGGLAVVNDSKYSISCPDNELRLTVANTSIYADHYGQKTRDDDCRHADMGEQEFSYQLIPVSGSWKDKGLSHRGEAFNRKLIPIVETYHEGDLPPAYRGIEVDKDDVTVGAIKRSEDDTGYVIRLIETTGDHTHAVINLSLLDRRFSVDMNPFEIKTLMIPDGGDIKEILATEL